MKIRRPFVIILLLLPLAVGLVCAVVLQSRPEANPVLVYQFRVDLGTCLLIGGGLLSAIAFGVWGFRASAQHRLDNAVEGARQEARDGRRRFLRQLDHELKNPLTALQAELAYLKQDLPAENGHVLDDMNDQIERLRLLITDLRKLSQVEDQPLEHGPVDVGQLLQEVAEAVEERPGVAEGRVHLTLLDSPWRLPPVSGDRGLLWLACFNLLDNALKFSPPSARIELRAMELSPWLVVEVADNGPGIPPEDVPHVFDELYRGGNARGLPGSGLGLSLVRAIITRHGGDVSVRSRPGQGTVFTLRLPVAR